MSVRTMRRVVGKLPAVLLVLFTGTVVWLVVEDRVNLTRGTTVNDVRSAADCPCVLYTSNNPSEIRRDSLPRQPSTRSAVESLNDDIQKTNSVQNVTHSVNVFRGEEVGAPMEERHIVNQTIGDHSYPKMSHLVVKKSSAEVRQDEDAAKLEDVKRELKELEQMRLEEEAMYKKEKEKTDLLLQLQDEFEKRLLRKLEEKKLQQEQEVRKAFLAEGKLRQENILQNHLQEFEKLQADKKQKVKVDEASLYINPGSFVFTLSNADACKKGANSDGHVDVLCLVFTAPGDRLMRSRIRKTWGGAKEVKGKRIVTMFLLGQRGSDFKQQILDEDNEHHDIVQQNFTDSYYNLTLKTLMGLRWASEFCSNARFIVKMDIDMFVNVYNLADRIDKAPAVNLAEGNRKEVTEPIRAKQSKWYTSRDMYPDEKYPPYLNGPAYLISGDLAGRIYKESFNVRFLPWEDAFIGIIMKRLNVEPKYNSRYDSYLNYNNKEDALRKIGSSITFHLGENKEENKRNIVTVWKYVQDLNNATVTV